LGKGEGGRCFAPSLTPTKKRAGAGVAAPILVFNLGGNVKAIRREEITKEKGN